MWCCRRAARDRAEFQVFPLPCIWAILARCSAVAQAKLCLQSSKVGSGATVFAQQVLHQQLRSTTFLQDLAGPPVPDSGMRTKRCR